MKYVINIDESTDLQEGAARQSAFHKGLARYTSTFTPPTAELQG